LAFLWQGSTGHITVKLAHPTSVKAIGIEHLAKADALDIRTAPQDFVVFGYGLGDSSDEM
jgi:hypothetical protein